MNGFADRRYVAVYRTIRTLPEDYRPVDVFRKDGKTIIAIDPRSTRFQVVDALVQQLTDLEANALRDGFGLPHRNVGSLPPQFVSDDPTLLYVPPALRLPGEDAIQGGLVLKARILVGDLPHEEIQMLEDEPLSLHRTRELAYWASVRSKVLRVMRDDRSQVG